jgi:hypothetical protein
MKKPLSDFSKTNEILHAAYSIKKATEPDSSGPRHYKVSAETGRLGLDVQKEEPSPK